MGMEEVSLLRSASGGSQDMFLEDGREGTTPARELEFGLLRPFFELQALVSNFATLRCAEVAW